MFNKLFAFFIVFHLFYVDCLINADGVANEYSTFMYNHSQMAQNLPIIRYKCSSTRLQFSN